MSINLAKRFQAIRLRILDFGFKKNGMVDLGIEGFRNSAIGGLENERNRI
jgi:hypothetical protein